LADWLVSALAAGQAAGGDSRGRQAAGVLVVRHNGGYGGNNDRYLDLRVDDHPDPIDKLAELVTMHHLLFGEVDPANLIPLADVTRMRYKLLCIVSTIMTARLTACLATRHAQPCERWWAARTLRSDGMGLVT
jgi:hypothetical protein